MDILVCDIFHILSFLQFANLRNRTIQVVMPRGIIEVPLTGHIGDFDGNVLLNTSDIDNINDIIKVEIFVFYTRIRLKKIPQSLQKAGEIKIKTMTRSAIFRRKIIYKEWEHKMLQMEVKNMQDYLSIIEKCKVLSLDNPYKLPKIKLYISGNKGSPNVLETQRLGTSRRFEPICTESRN